MRSLTLMVLSLWSSTAIAQEPGKFTFLGQDQCAPFEGVLFDPAATATILAEQAAVQSQCEIKMKYALDTQATEHALELQNLRIRHDSLTSECDARASSLEKENKALTEALQKQTKRNPAIWAAAGLASGIALSYGAYRVFNEQ